MIHSSQLGQARQCKQSEDQSTSVDSCVEVHTELHYSLDTHSSQSVITRGGSEGRQSVNDTTHSSQSITMTLGSSQLIHYTAAVEHTHNIHGLEG